MFCPMLKNPCAPPPTSPKCPPPKTHYFFVERTPTEAPKKRSNSHPRSASKSSNGSRKCCACGSKNASSDSKIIKNKSNNKRSATPARNNNKESNNNNNNKGSKIDPDSVKQLKQDLKTIKDQLTILTQNRDEALNLTNELEVRYKSLLEKSQRQEREIEELTQKNVTLESKCQSLGKSQSKSDLNELNALFRELVDKSKIMEESKNKVCRCIKEKSHEYQEMANSTKELSKVIAERDAKYATLMKNYQKTRENETKLKEFNQRLIKTVEELESQLHQAMMEIEASHQEASALAQKYQHELNETSKTFTEEMQLKAKEMADLNSVILELKTRVSQTTGMETKFVQLLQQYKSVNEKLKSAQDLCQCRTDELEMQKKKEKNLVCELVDLRQTVADLSRCKCDDGANLADLRGTNDEKEKIIQYQRAELASKDKQIDLLLKNEDRMKNKLVQLQEKLVEMKMSTNNHHQSKVLCGDVCSANLTQELQEIITALYEEIEKGLSKDEQILSQNREICNLQCTLNTKEKALIYACNQLKILRDQFQATLNEKRTLAEQLQDVTVESTFEDSSDPNAEECSCASC